MAKLGQRLDDALTVHELESELRCAQAREQVTARPMPPVLLAALGRTLRADREGRVTPEQFRNEIWAAADTLYR